MRLSVSVLRSSSCSCEPAHLITAIVHRQQSGKYQQGNGGAEGMGLALSTVRLEGGVLGETMSRQSRSPRSSRGQHLGGGHVGGEGDVVLVAQIGDIFQVGVQVIGLGSEKKRTMSITL
jgi:hypothetical protein